jgi:hypothetical protein
MKLIIFILFGINIVQLYATTNNRQIIKAESSTPIVFITPIFFNNAQIVLPNEFDISINNFIESRLNNGNYLYQDYSNKFILQNAQFKKNITKQDYILLFNKIRNIEPPIQIKSNILELSIESNTSLDRTYLLIGQLDQFSFAKYIDYIKENDSNSCINNLLIQIRYYIISLSNNTYLGSFIATGSIGVAKIGEELTIDYNIKQLIMLLFYNLKDDTINNMIFIDARYYDTKYDNLHLK